MENINNNIKEPICSFDVSNLLKEKGFDVLNSNYYVKEIKRDGKTGGDIYTGNINLVKGVPYFLKEKVVCSAPTHSIALEWIRVNFLIDIECRAVRYAGDEKASYYSANVNGSVVLFQKRFDTPSEAIDAALLHVLKEII
jgi:hypothetical protein